MKQSYESGKKEMDLQKSQEVINDIYRCSVCVHVCKCVCEHSFSHLSYPPTLMPTSQMHHNFLYHLSTLLSHHPFAIITHNVQDCENRRYYSFVHCKQKQLQSKIQRIDTNFSSILINSFQYEANWIIMSFLKT